MIIKDWDIEAMTGYKPISTFYTDFSVADLFGEEGIIDTFQRAFKYWKTDYKMLTELVMVLNWKIWEHYDMDSPYTELYDALWRKADLYAQKHLKGEELTYFFRTTD